MLETSLFLRLPSRGGTPSLPLLSLCLLYFFLPPFEDLGCFSGCLMSSASIQKLFCGIYSAFKCSFDEFVGEKVFSPSYSSTILAPPPSIISLIRPSFEKSSSKYTFTYIYLSLLAFPGGSADKESTCNEGGLGLIPGLGRSPVGGHGNPLQYSCLGNPHEQRSLVGYSPWGRKESDTTERLCTFVSQLFDMFVQSLKCSCISRLSNLLVYNCYSILIFFFCVIG